MKKKILFGSIILSFFMLGLFVNNASSQTRIRFQQGASSTTVSGTLSRRSSKRVYVIGAKRGQTMSIETESDLGITVYAPGGREVQGSDAGSWRTQYYLRDGGDYRIVMQGVNRYRVKLSIH